MYQRNFPFVLKHVNTTLAPKNVCRGSKDNDCSLRIYVEQFASKYQCRLRKGFSTQHCLLGMLEERKRSVKRSVKDLSKAFDCFSHELIIAKLNVSWLSLSALALISNYFTNRK